MSFTLQVHRGQKKRHCQRCGEVTDQSGMHDQGYCSSCTYLMSGLSVECPTCGVRPNEQCISTGVVNYKLNTMHERRHVRAVRQHALDEAIQLAAG